MKLLERPIAQANLIGGRLCLDFVNTVSGWVEDLAGKSNSPFAVTAQNDKLVEYDDLLAWSVRSGLLNEPEAQTLSREAGRRPKEAKTVMTRAIHLREAIHHLCLAVIKQTPPSPIDLDLLNREINEAFDHARLIPSRKSFQWEWNETKKKLDRILWPIADSAAELLTSGDLSRLHECGGKDCGWLFEDASKNGRRHWCEMQTCGNLAKVRRFRQKKRDRKTR